MWERPLRRDSEWPKSRDTKVPPTLGSDRREGGLQIVDQVVHFFDADREPDERIGYSERLAHLGRDRTVGHDRGMIDEAFHAAQTFCQGKEMRVLQESTRPCEIRFQNNRHHSAERSHLLLRELVLRMLVEARVINLLDLRLLLEPARDLEGVLAMTFHPKRERFQTAQRQETVERSSNRADRVLQKRNLVAQLLVFTDDNDPADHVGMAVQIFRRGMNDHVEAELDRALH